MGDLLAWFGQHRRQMPWRDHPRPYEVWISEIMLQQTQVNTVRPYFARFVKAFPSVERLAAAELQAVLKVWEGLGYYARARNLHKAARLVVSQYGGLLPDRTAGLRELPGIGEYAAAAIASISHNEAVPAVDGNVLRVFSRFWALTDDIAAPRTRQALTARLAPYVPPEAGDFNQAVMELGALVCRPRGPQCGVCPLQRGCKARAGGLTDQLPVRKRRGDIPHRHVGVAVIRRGDRVLIARRRPERMLGGLWEFPGGKQEPGEAIDETIRREIMEETGLHIRVGERLCMIRHAYSHFRVTLHVYRCTSVSGRARPHDSDEIRWAPIARLEDFPFPVSNREIVRLLKTGT